MRYTTSDGRPLSQPQPGITVVYARPSISYLLVLDCVFMPEPPPAPSGR